MDIMFLAFFISVPVVLLAAAAMFVIYRQGGENGKLAGDEKGSPKRLWAVTIVLALVFTIAGIPKLGGVDSVLTSFQHWGYPESFHHVVGGIEFVGAILLLIPAVATYAAFVLGGVMVGAAVTHLSAGELYMLPVNLILLGGLMWMAYRRFPDMSGSRWFRRAQRREVTS